MAYAAERPENLYNVPLTDAIRALLEHHYDNHKVEIRSLEITWGFYDDPNPDFGRDRVSRVTDIKAESTFFPRRK